MKASIWLFLTPVVFFGCSHSITEPPLEIEPGPHSSETNLVNVELWAGRVKYAAYDGGAEWRATFEVKVLLPSGENIRERCSIDFYWKQKKTKPTPDESNWSGGQYYKHGLASIDGHWLDRQPAVGPPPWWMRARIYSHTDKLLLDVIGMCNFLEEVERPDRGWTHTLDMGYGLGDRILAIESQTSDLTHPNADEEK